MANRGQKRWDVRRGVVRGVLLISLALGSAGCQTGGPAPERAGDPTAAALRGSGRVEDLAVVDCLLPGKIQKIGRQVIYQTPRQPVKNTASECEIRGGEYVAYDRANYQTALAVWLPQAEAGDAKAQAYVGEIYEKGLGTSPDFRKAAEWYGKAAKQGYSRAQINLAYLYEKGLGIPQDRAAAGRLYAQAFGLAGSVPLEEAPPPQGESETIRALRAEVERLQGESARLRQQLQEAERQLREQRGNAAEIQRLRERLATLAEELRRKERAISNADDQPSPPVALPPGISFGRYYALVIGNNEYRHLPKLETAVNDAREIAEVLEDRYGFQVKLLEDATAYDIFSALSLFRENLSERDNFILYYAGHGELDEVNLRGHWLPVDAEPDNPAYWISNIEISDLLNIMSARHVLVVADSCYSGIMTRSAITGPSTVRSEDALKEWLQTLADKRSRTVLTSGGLKPVIEGGGGDHSLFAKNLLEVLKNHRGLLEGQRLYRDLSPRVSQAASQLGIEQIPEYAPMQFAGHEGGDFLFVPRAEEARTRPGVTVAGGKYPALAIAAASRPGPP